MNKMLLLFALALTCVSVRAQHTVYCEIMQFSPGGLKSMISVDFDNNGTDEIVGTDGKKVKFNSSIDALSYFEKLGWTVVSAYSTTHNSGLAKVPVVHYLMQKKVSSYGEKMNGILTKKGTPIKKKSLGDDGYFE